MKHTQLLLLAVFLNLFISCSDDETTPIPEPSGAYENGILIANEGPFAGGSGTVSFMSNDYSKIEQNIYQNVNGDNTGNVLNSIGFYDENAYLVANVSNRITVVDRHTFEKISVIEDGLNNPRFFEAINDVGFVTNWGDPLDNSDDYVAAIDLTSGNIISKISVAFGPEKMLVVGNKLYVAHKGGYGHNNLISVIDPALVEVEEEIEVGDVPGSMLVDIKGDLWVLCEGIPAWTGSETNGSLVRINTNTNQVISELDFGTGNHPQFLASEIGYFYYSLNGNVYKMSDTSLQIPTEALISGVFFYNMEVENGVLYGADAKDFASNGSIEIYNLNDASFMNSIPVGIIPGGIYFNN